MKKNKTNNIKHLANNFGGIKKIIHKWFSDTNINYKINLYSSSKDYYFESFWKYMKEDRDFQESRELALSDVYASIYSFSNIRK